MAYVLLEGVDTIVDWVWKMDRKGGEEFVMC